MPSINLKNKKKGNITFTLDVSVRLFDSSAMYNVIRNNARVITKKLDE